MAHMQSPYLPDPACSRSSQDPRACGGGGGAFWPACNDLTLSSPPGELCARRCCGPTRSRTVRRGHGAGVAGKRLLATAGVSGARVGTSHRAEKLAKQAPGLLSGRATPPARRLYFALFLSCAEVVRAVNHVRRRQSRTCTSYSVQKRRECESRESGINARS